MKLAILGATSLLAICYACQPTSTPPSAAEAAVKPAEDPVKRGEYLVHLGGCNDCHSAKRMGPNGPEIIAETKLAGYPATQPVPSFDSKMTAQGFAMFTPDLTAAKGPWGISFAANLTPDESGIGNWTLEQFKTCLTQGKAKGLADGRPLLPPMPWQNLTQLKDEDIAAMFAYLKSIPPVRNVVPSPIPPTPG